MPIGVVEKKLRHQAQSVLVACDQLFRVFKAEINSEASDKNERPSHVPSMSLGKCKSDVDERLLK